MTVAYLESNLLCPDIVWTYLESQCLLTAMFLGPQTELEDILTVCEPADDHREVCVLGVVDGSKTR